MTNEHVQRIHGVFIEYYSMFTRRNVRCNDQIGFCNRYLARYSREGATLLNPKITRPDITRPVKNDHRFRSIFRVDGLRNLKLQPPHGPTSQPQRHFWPNPILPPRDQWKTEPTRPAFFGARKADDSLRRRRSFNRSTFQ